MEPWKVITDPLKATELYFPGFGSVSSDPQNQTFGQLLCARFCGLNSKM